jgi:hypothetical protein
MRRHRDWFWRLRLLGPREIAGIVIVVALVAMSVPFRSPNSGFGPEWDCQAQAQGDPVCIKKGVE